MANIAIILSSYTHDFPEIFTYLPGVACMRRLPGVRDLVPREQGLLQGPLSGKWNIAELIKSEICGELKMLPRNLFKTNF